MTPLIMLGRGYFILDKGVGCNCEVVNMFPQTEHVETVVRDISGVKGGY